LCPVIFDPKKHYPTLPKIIEIRDFGMSPVIFFVKKCQKKPPKQCVLEELFYMVKNTQKTLAFLHEI
jgi:hypothetical protein